MTWFFLNNLLDFKKININRIKSHSSVFKLTCKKYIEHNSLESIVTLKFEKEIIQQHKLKK